MEIHKFIYNDKTIDFDFNQDSDVMVNANQMAKVFGREMKDFNKLESTKNFIEACLISEDSSLIGIEKKENLIISKRNSGTWMHRILALKFAAWLDPNFEVWVFTTIDKLLLGDYHEQREATKAKLKAENELEAKKKELLKKYPEFKDFVDIEEKINEADKRRNKAMRESLKQLKLQFN